MWPFSKKHKADEPPKLEAAHVERVVNAWGKRLETADPATFYDVSTLPYPKAEIERCVLAAMVIMKGQPMRDVLAAGLVSLADFQEGVGTDGLRLLPVIPKLDENDLEGIQNAARLIAAHGTQNEAKFEKLKALAAADQARYLAATRSL
nr:hypothetical protein [Nitrosomonas nitrosa]